MKMSYQGQLQSRVMMFRQLRRWSQEELGRRAGISRAGGETFQIE
jgi:DNA-binding XRE family transcriptional regulator